MIVKKLANGEYYACRKIIAKMSRKRTEPALRDWWIVKSHHQMESKGAVLFSKGFQIVFPKELVGKKVRFKIEVME